MPEDIVQGNSIEEIKLEWAPKLGLSPRDLMTEVIERSERYPHTLKVRLSWSENIIQDPQSPSQQVNWDGSKYVIAAGESVKKILPFIQAGEVWLNGKHQDRPFHITLGDQVEFHPFFQLGHF